LVISLQIPPIRSRWEEINLVIGKDDAYEMINEAEKDAEKWWEGRAKPS